MPPQLPKKNDLCSDLVLEETLDVASVVASNVVVVKRKRDLDDDPAPAPKRSRSGPANVFGTVVNSSHASAPSIKKLLVMSLPVEEVRSLIASIEMPLDLRPYVKAQNQYQLPILRYLTDDNLRFTQDVGGFSSAFCVL
jgi:hypothetical protein